MSRFQLSLIIFSVLMLTTAAPKAWGQEQEQASTADEVYTVGKAKTTTIKPKCSEPDDSGEIVVCADPDVNERYRIPKELREKRTTFKGDVPNAPDVFGIPDHGPVVARGCFLGPCPKEPIIPYTADQLPDVDLEYMELARQAEAEERRRQAETAEPD